MWAEKSSGKEVNETISANVQQKYRSVVEMDTMIEKYCNAYAKDLEECLGIRAHRKLPKNMSVPTLLNPMFGLKPQIVVAGLMTGDQYNAAKKKLICMMQDILDRKFPIVHESSNEDCEGDSNNNLLPDYENLNFSRAEEEIGEFEKLKKEVSTYS